MALKLFLIGGIAGAWSLVPQDAHADPELTARCVWKYDAGICQKGCDEWLFTYCRTNGSQGCYDSSGACS